MDEEKKLKLWLARNEGWEDDEDDGIYHTGELLVCYDKPILEYDSKKGRKVWSYSRIMHEAPIYMFPEIEEGQCVEFTNRNISKEIDELVSKLKE